MEKGFGRLGRGVVWTVGGLKYFEYESMEPSYRFAGI